MGSVMNPRLNEDPAAAVTAAPHLDPPDTAAAPPGSRPDPVGATGARIMVTLLHAMQKSGKTLGLATLCGGGGVSSPVDDKRSRLLLTVMVSYGCGCCCCRRCAREI